jgi:hypothetical protein
MTIAILAKLAGATKVSGIAHWARLRTEWLCHVLNLPRKQLPCANTYVLPEELLEAIRKQSAQ